MNPTILLPELPDTTDPKAVKDYLAAHQKILADKQKNDYESINSIPDNNKEKIENMIIEWALVDPLNLSNTYQICNGDLWREGSYAKTYWDAKGVTTIPNMMGQFPRSMAKGNVNDPDRNYRRQSVAGTVQTGGLVITLPEYHVNIIKEAKDSGREVYIGILVTDIFTTSTMYAITSYDISAKTVTIGTAIATGSQTLVIKGDVVGSFQNDNYISHVHAGTSGRDGPAADMNNSNYLSIGSAYSTGTLYYPPYAYSGGLETRPKNIALLPVMMVNLSSGSAYSQSLKTLEISTESEAKSGTDNTKIITPLSLRQGFNANGSAPIYACRAWVNFNGTGTVAIRGSGNVSSITDNGTGNYYINFTTPMEDLNYCTFCSADLVQTYTSDYTQAHADTTGRVWFYHSEGGGTPYDSPYCSVSVFR